MPSEPSHTFVFPLKSETKGENHLQNSREREREKSIAIYVTCTIVYIWRGTLHAESPFWRIGNVFAYK